MKQQRNLDIALSMTNQAWELFMESTKKPQEYRDKAWLKIFAEIKNGPFWRKRVKFSNDTVIPLSQFEITEFADYEPVLKPDSESRISPLTQKPIIWWAHSTGTTSANKKMFPYTEQVYLDRVQQQSLISMNFLLRHLTDFAAFKILNFSAFGPSYFPTNHLPYGMTTAFYRVFSENDVRAVPRPVYRDLATFKKWGPLYALTSEVVIINGPTAAPLIEFLANIQQYSGQLLELLSSGAEKSEGLPEIPKNPERIEFLKHLLQQKRSLKLKEIWPSLQLLSFWKSGSSAVLVDRLTPFLSPEIKVIHEATASTEQFMTYPSLDEKVGGALDTIYGVTEFIEAGQPIKTSSLIPSWELEVNKKYETFVTNSIGLVRYRMHDIFTCIGHIGSVPILEFFQKEGANIALGVAFISEGDFLEALRRIDLKLSGKWIFAPGKDFRNLEIIHDGSNSKFDEVVAAIDESLRAIHTAYNGTRSRGQLLPMSHRVLEQSHKFWLSFPDGVQAKMPVVLKEPFAG